MSETPKRTAPTSDPHGPRSYANGHPSRPLGRTSDAAPDFPTTGTFRSSWRPVLRYAIGMGLFIGAGVAAGIWSTSGLIDTFAVTMIVGLPLAVGGWEVLKYRFVGTQQVEITSDEIRVVTVAGKSILLRKCDPFGIEMKGDEVKLVAGSEKLVVNDTGFASDTWTDLTFALMDWKREAPLSSLPGVLVPGPVEARALEKNPVPEVEGELGDAVYVAQHDKAVFWGLPFFGACALVGLTASWDNYQQGTWLSDPMMSIALPVIGLGFCGAFLWALPRLVRRVAFQPETFIVERFAGKPIQLPYSAVKDAFGVRLKTNQGRFILGQRNSGSFTRLLLPRLETAQLSGEMLDDTLEDLGTLVPSMVALLLIGLVLPLVLMFAFDFSESWATFSMMIGLVVMGVCAIVLQRLRAARRRRNREVR